MTVSRLAHDPRAAVAALLLGHALLLAWPAWHHSPTYDETGHLPAGIHHWRSGRFELYRVNPPLVRLIAALPVMAAGAKTDWGNLSMVPGDRPEFQAGRDFMRANGADSFWYFALARWACLPFSLLGGYVCYRWARDLWGTPAGLVALAVWCSSPMVLGNAQTIQPDAPAAAMAVAVAYLFRRWCRRPRLETALVVGVALGLALLVKTTLALLLALLPALWLVQRWPSGWSGRREFLREATQLVLVWGLAVYVLNAGYLFHRSFRRLGDYAFVSNALKGSPGRGSRYSGGETVGNRFAGSWLASVPVPLPEDYVLGIDLQKRDFEGRLRSYLRGEMRYRGWWYFYLYGLAVKTPVGMLALLAIAAGTIVTRGPAPASWPDVAFLILPAAAMLALISSETGMNNHVRYGLPALPFLFVLAGAAGRTLRPDQPLARAGLPTAVALLAGIAGSLAAYPHSHSYFNELVGGPARGHFQLLSSNIDYGEDLLYLKDWLRENAPGRPLTLAYFGNFDPRIAGIEFTLPPRGPHSQRREGAAEDVLGPVPGLHAVSVNYLHGTSVPLHDGRGGLSLGDEYSYFLEFEPKARIGGAIYVYDLRLDEANRVRRKLGLPVLPATGGR